MSARAAEAGLLALLALTSCRAAAADEPPEREQLAEPGPGEAQGLRAFQRASAGSAVP